MGLSRFSGFGLGLGLGSDLRPWRFVLGFGFRVQGWVLKGVVCRLYVRLCYPAAMVLNLRTPTERCLHPPLGHSAHTSEGGAKLNPTTINASERLGQRRALERHCSNKDGVSCVKRGRVEKKRAKKLRRTGELKQRSMPQTTECRILAVRKRPP